VHQMVLVDVGRKGLYLLSKLESCGIARWDVWVYYLGVMDMLNCWVQK